METVIFMNHLETHLTVEFYGDCVVVKPGDVPGGSRNLEIVPPIRKWRELDGRAYELGKQIIAHLSEMKKKA